MDWISFTMGVGVTIGAIMLAGLALIAWDLHVYGGIISASCSKVVGSRYPGCASGDGGGRFDDETERRKFEQGA